MTSNDLVTTDLPRFAEPWGGVGHVADLDGPVHWVDFGGPTDGAGAPDRAPVLLVHGLGGSHLNWVAVASTLARTRRVVAIDLIGFGLTRALGRSASVRANAAMLARFVREVLGEPAVVLGNSMGGMVATLLTDTEPDLVVGLGLVDAALPLRRDRLDPLVAAQFGLYLTPRLAEWGLARYRQRLDPRARVEGTMRLCFADWSRADDVVVEVGVDLIRHQDRAEGMDDSFLEAARSLLALLRHPRRYAAALAHVCVPVLVVHGTADRLVPVTAAERVARTNPRFRIEQFPGVGHTPQLEVPEQFLAVVEPWLASIPD